MSKAAEFVAVANKVQEFTVARQAAKVRAEEEREKAEQLRPTFSSGQDFKANINDQGGLSIGDHFEQFRLDPFAAQAFAAWILDVYAPIPTVGEQDAD